jgi:ElaB/YqjD/DUF883 family membrane-anchored ribosome-binding protein
MNPEAKIYQEQINNKATSFLSALDDFKKYYVYYNKNPEVQEYNKNFTDSKEQLQTLSSDVFQITNTIQRKIEEKSRAISGIEMKLQRQKVLSKEQEKTVNNLKSIQAGSSVMIDDSKTDYIFNYYKNLEIFVGILILLGLLVSSKLAIAILVIFIVYKLNVFQQLMKILVKIFQ